MKRRELFTRSVPVAQPAERPLTKAPTSYHCGQEMKNGAEVGSAPFIGELSWLSCCDYGPSIIALSLEFVSHPLTCSGAPGGTRTHDLAVVISLLCPTELPGHQGEHMSLARSESMTL